jgi:hypothetical protein
VEVVKRERAMDIWETTCPGTKSRHSEVHSNNLLRPFRGFYTTCLCSAGEDGAETGGRIVILVPGTRAGLKRRSQSAHAEPTPVPVANAMGHVRPENRHDDMSAGKGRREE